MSISILILLILAFLFSAFAIIALSDIVIKKNIRKELLKYGYTLISIKDTDEKFTPKDYTQSPSWRDHVNFKYSSAGLMEYKEILFKKNENEKRKSLVAIETFLFFPRKIYVQIDLGKS